jgi:hypothetical protein
MAPSIWVQRGMAVGFAVALCGAAQQAEAQRFGRGATPNAGACFYEDVDFRGDYFCMRAGEEIESLPRDMNDRISSIRTFGRGVEVTVYQNPQFSGRASRFAEVPNLVNQGWNDRISSIRVESVGGGFGRRDNRDDRDFRGFGGGGGREADRIVRRAYEDVLNREPDAEGLRVYRSRIIDEGWTEQQVREALRDSPEYRANVRGTQGTRAAMTRERATEVVRRAYLSVLNREPDAGAEGYIDQVMRQGWTEEDVARELRRSPEFRQGRPRR